MSTTDGFWEGTMSKMLTSILSTNLTHLKKPVPSQNYGSGTELKVSFGLGLRGRKGEKPKKIQARILHPPVPAPACYPTAYKFLCARQGSNSCLKQSPVVKAELTSGDAFWWHTSWFSSAKPKAAGSLYLTSQILHPYATHLLLHSNPASDRRNKEIQTVVKILRNYFIFVWKLSRGTFSAF